MTFSYLGIHVHHLYRSKNGPQAVRLHLDLLNSDDLFAPKWRLMSPVFEGPETPCFWHRFQQEQGFQAFL
jgi:hypothetical protein